MPKSSKDAVNTQSVKNFCDTNEDFFKLLALFTEGYMPLYNKRKAKHREAVQDFLNRNFFTWYYAEANHITEFSPANFITSQVYHKFGSGFTVVPIPMPEYKKSKLLSIRYSFHVYTMEGHQLLHDFYALLESIKKTGAPDEFAFLFGNNHYSSFLTEIGIESGFLLLDSGRASLNEKKIAAFSQLNKKEQLHKLLTFHLGNFLGHMKKMKNPGKIPSTGKMLKLLGMGLDYEDLVSRAFPGIISSAMKYMSSVGSVDFDSMGDSESGLKKFDNLLDNTLDMQMTFSILTSAVFVCCGLYFQIIEPYYSCFDFNELDGAFLDAVMSADPEQFGVDKDSYYIMMSHLYYFKPAILYTLTPIGAELFGKDYEKEEAYALVDESSYDKVLQAMLAPREETTMGPSFEDFMEMFEGGLFGRFPDEVMQKKGEILQFPRAKSVLEGLNPNNKPVFKDKKKTYRFKVGRKIITIGGMKTLTDLGFAIQNAYKLHNDHLSSFYMGHCFYEAEREIRFPEPFGGDGDSDCDSYLISDLNLFMGQKFLYLFDFGSERRFTITFDGYEN